MDQLDLLRKDWKKQNADLPKLTSNELKKIIHKKSSSVVKWIFIISLLEFLLPIVLFLFVGADNINDRYRALGLYEFNLITTILMYAIAVVFMILFYLNYRKISAESSAKVLLTNIIRTRKTVKYYIWISLSMIPILVFVTAFQMLHAPEYAPIFKQYNIVIIWFIVSFIAVSMVGLGWLIYRLLYGILLKRLHKNYKELHDFKG
ncbi:hypothetical protein MWU59_12035 [Flavobacteriaceae bacterium F08102]|nr:hypothetical protein [Flavobacteriaceae bacterium F08102]